MNRRSREPFKDRIARSAQEKGSPIVVAVDPPFGQRNLAAFASRILRSAGDRACAVKLNFHMLLPLSALQVSNLNGIAHSFGLQSIADIKLNDIGETSLAALKHLSAMGFDAVIANPFVGRAELASLTEAAHRMSMGVIALVYMSHTGAPEGYGLHASEGDRKRPVYRIFLDRAIAAGADGIVVGATRPDILSEIAGIDGHPPIYSPGVGAQGGDIGKAVAAGAAYPIIGRAIISARDPRQAIAKALQKISRARQI